MRTKNHDPFFLDNAEVWCELAKSLVYGKGKKIPTVASLRAEYAAAMDEKKKAYAGYREAKGEMRELLIARENVDRLLNISGRGRECDTEREDV